MKRSGFKYVGFRRQSQLISLFTLDIPWDESWINSLVWGEDADPCSSLLSGLSSPARGNAPVGYVPSPGSLTLLYVSEHISLVLKNQHCFSPDKPSVSQILLLLTSHNEVLQADRFSAPFLLLSKAHYMQYMGQYQCFFHEKESYRGIKNKQTNKTLKKTWIFKSGLQAYNLSLPEGSVKI